MLTKNQILAVLPKLKPDDLSAIHAMAGHLLGGATGASNQPAHPLAAPVIGAMGEALGLTAGLTNLPPATVKLLLPKLEPLNQFFDSNFPDWSKVKVARAAFLRQMMVLLRDNLKSMKIEPNYLVLIRNLHRMPEVFESAFPNYLVNGLGVIIVDKLMK